MRAHPSAGEAGGEHPVHRGRGPRRTDVPGGRQRVRTGCEIASRWNARAVASVSRPRGTRFSMAIGPAGREVAGDSNQVIELRRSAYRGGGRGTAITRSPCPRQARPIARGSRRRAPSRRDEEPRNVNNVIHPSGWSRPNAAPQGTTSRGVNNVIQNPRHRGYTAISTWPPGPARSMAGRFRIVDGPGQRVRAPLPSIPPGI
jgi:hypothetical protein